MSRKKTRSKSGRMNGHDNKVWAESNYFTCESKKAFPSYREAAEFNNSIRKHGSIRAKGKRIERMEVYRCIRCRQFHIGHPPRKNQIQYR